MKGKWRVVTCLLVFWLLGLLHMNVTLYNSNDDNELTEPQLSKAMHDLDLLKHQKHELLMLAHELRWVATSYSHPAEVLKRT